MSDTIGFNGVLASIDFRATIDLEGDGKRSYQPATALPVGKATTAWVLSTLTATVAAEHGLVTGDKIDAYWSDGKRLGTTITVDGNNITLAGGHGDAFPADGTSLILSKPEALSNISFLGNAVTAFVMSANVRVAFDFLNAAGESQYTVDVVAAPFPEFWALGLKPNPLKDKSIASATVSNASATVAATPKMVIQLET